MDPSSPKKEKLKKKTKKEPKKNQKKKNSNLKPSLLFALPYCLCIFASVSSPLPTFDPRLVYFLRSQVYPGLVSVAVSCSKPTRSKAPITTVDWSQTAKLHRNKEDPQRLYLQLTCRPPLVFGFGGLHSSLASTPHRRTCARMRRFGSGHICPTTRIVDLSDLYTLVPLFFYLHLFSFFSSKSPCLSVLSSHTHAKAEEWATLNYFSFGAETRPSLWL